MKSRYERYSKLRSFKAYCDANRYELLEDDYKFIDRILNNHDKSDFKAILDLYLKNWSIGMGMSSIESSRQSLGRRMANLWLLEYTNNEKVPNMNT